MDIDKLTAQAKKLIDVEAFEHAGENLGYLDTRPATHFVPVTAYGTARAGEAHSLVEGRLKHGCVATVRMPKDTDP